MPVAPPKRNMLADIKDHYRKQNMKQVKMPHEPKDDQSNKTNNDEKCKTKEDQECRVKFYQDIFHRKGKQCQNIYIKGVAGSGKSVFCQNMTSKWCDINSPGYQDNRSDLQSRPTGEDGSHSSVQLTSNSVDDSQSDDQLTSNFEHFCNIDVERMPSCEDDGLSDAQWESSNEDDDQSDALSISSNDSDELNSEQVEETNTLFLQKFEFLFYIQLRYATEHRDIVTMIKDNLLMEDESLGNVLTDILKNEPEKCLVILDGLDEWAPPKGSKPSPYVTRGLPGRNIMTNWTVLTTTRPCKLELVRPESEEMDQLIELSGLTQYSAIQCIASVVEYLNVRFQTDKSASTCKRDLSTDELEHFMTLPVLLKQLVCVWFDEGHVGSSQCDIYAGMIDVYLRYAGQRQENLDSLICSASETDARSLPACLNNRESCKYYNHQLYSLSKLAFHTLFCEDRESSLVFNSAKTELYGMTKAETDLWLIVGLLSQDIANERSSFDQKRLCFPHKSIQEFLAAVYISICDDSSTFKKITDSCTSLEILMEMSEVFIFVAGMRPAAFTEISEHIAKVASNDTEIQAYRSECTVDTCEFFLIPGHSSSRFIGLIQQLMLKCIQETKNNNQTCTGVHVQDVILDLYGDDWNYNTCRYNRKFENLFSLNKENVVSLKYNGKMSQLNADTVKFICSKITQLKVCYAYGNGIIADMLNRNQNTLEVLYLTNIDPLVHRTPVDVFKQCINLHAIHFSCSCYRHHELNDIAKMVKNNTKLRNIKMSDLNVIPSYPIFAAGKFCDDNNGLDLSQNTLLQELYLKDVFVVKTDDLIFDLFFGGELSEKMTNYTIRNTSSWHLDLSLCRQLQTLTLDQLYADKIIVNTTNLEKCTMTVVRSRPDATVKKDPAMITFEFIGDALKLKYLHISWLCLKYDQLAGLLSFVTKAKLLTVIHLSVMPSMDGDRKGELWLDLSEHIHLQRLQLKSSPAMNVRVSAIQLVECLIEKLYLEAESKSPCSDLNISSIGFNGTAQKLNELNLKELVLNHYQVVELMTFLKESTRMEITALVEVRCSSCDQTCECQLDLSNHDHLREVKLEKLNVTVLRICTDRLRGCTIADMNRIKYASSTCSLFFSGTAQRLIYLYISNITLKHAQSEGLVSILTKATRLKEIVLSDIRCADCYFVCECQLDLSNHTRLGHLTLNKLRVNKVRINTTSLQTCKIANMSLTNFGPLPHDSSFQLKIGTAHNLRELELCSLTLSPGNHQTVMILIKRAIRLENVTLVRLKGADCGTRCECQPDLSNHTEFKEIKLDRVHFNDLKVKAVDVEMQHVHVVNELQINTAYLERCCINSIRTTAMCDSPLSSLDFIDTAQKLRDIKLNDLALKHDQFQTLMSILTQSTCLKDILLSELRCVECVNVCDCILNLSNHTLLENLKLNKLHINEVRAEAANLDISNLRTNVLQIKAERLLKCKIDDIRSTDSDTSQRGSALSTMEVLGIPAKFTDVQLSDLTLKHDQFQKLVSFLSECTCLNNVALSALKCVDCESTCDCRIELSKHRHLSRVKLDQLHINELQITVETIKSWEDGMLMLKNMIQDQPHFNRFNEIYLNNIHANTVSIRVNRLKVANSYIKELHVDTTELISCRIDNMMSTNNDHLQIHGNATPTFQFNGNAKFLSQVDIRKLAFHHIQFQELLSFLTQSAALLGWITLSEIACVDCLDACEWQLDLSNRMSLENVRLNKVNLNVLKMYAANLDLNMVPANALQINSVNLEKCTITNIRSIGSEPSQCDTVLASLEFRNTASFLRYFKMHNVTLKHEAFEGLLSFLTQTTCLKETILTDVRCADCAKECKYLLELSNHTKTADVYERELRW